MIYNENELSAIKKIIQLTHELTGVQLSERHHAMISSRLGKRLLELGLHSLSEYVAYFEKNKSEEKSKFISLLTTHHTYFFREFSHFEFLANNALPSLLSTVHARTDKKLRIWVAACSHGQEVYSLAMFLDFHLKRLDPALKYEILATDVDPESVAIAKNGVYLRDNLKDAPLAFVSNHWAKGTGDISEYVKARKSLTQNCHFQTGNLLELKPGSFPHNKFDIIF